MSQTNTPIPPQGPSQDLGGRSSTAASTAKDEAASVAENAKSQAGEVAGAAGEQAKAVVEDAKYQARRVVDDSRQQLMTQASEQTTKLAGSVRDVSKQLQGVKSGQAPQGIVGDIANQAADMTSRLAETLENRSPDELIGEVRSFARRRPGMFLLGALGAGFVAGRVVRSVDTQSLMDAAKSGADMDDGGSSMQPHDQPLTSASSMPASSRPSSGGFPQDLTPAVRP